MRVLPTIATTSVGTVARSWTVRGTARDTDGFTMHGVRVLVTGYDGRGNVIAVAYVTPSSSTLRAGQGTTFTAGLGAIAPLLTRVTARASR